MTETQPIVVLSSGGKDSLYMLARLRRDPAWRVEALVTTVRESDGRVAMHGTGAGLLRAQAQALGLELTIVEIPEGCPNDEYLARLGDGLAMHSEAGCEHVAFGDLFLEDIRRWREQSFRAMGWRPIFPVWKQPTTAMARDLAAPPWNILLTGVDTQVLDQSLLGRRYDASLLEDLPDDVDPCGENGEFHTFVCNGPGFRLGLAVQPGERRMAFGRYASLDLDPA